MLTATPATPTAAPDATQTLETQSVTDDSPGVTRAGYGPAGDALLLQQRLEFRAQDGHPDGLAALTSPENRATRMSLARAIAYAALALRAEEGLCNEAINLVHEANRLIARRPVPPRRRKVSIPRIVEFLRRFHADPALFPAHELPAPNLRLRINFAGHSSDNPYPDLLSPFGNLFASDEPESLAQPALYLVAPNLSPSMATATRIPFFPTSHPPTQSVPPAHAATTRPISPPPSLHPSSLSGFSPSFTSHLSPDHLSGGVPPPPPSAIPSSHPIQNQLRPSAAPAAPHLHPSSFTPHPSSLGLSLSSKAATATLLLLCLLLTALSPTQSASADFTGQRIQFDRSAGVGRMTGSTGSPNPRCSAMAAKSPAKLKCGVIGAGAIAGNHVQGFLAHPGAELIAIADTSQERCTALANQYNVPRRYFDTKDLLADKDIDVVGIALPNFLHAPVSIAALQAGKHVFLDKPFALSAGEARKVAAVAKKTGRKLMIGMSHRFPKDSQSLRQLVDKGVLGDVYSARAMWLRRSGIPKFGTWFGRKDQAGGGCLYDIGVHYLDKAMFTMNCYDVESVHGQVYTKFGDRGLGEGGWGKSDRGKHIFDVDDFALALIKLKGGKTISLNVSWAAHNHTGNEEYVQLFGTEAGAMVEPLRIWRNGKNGYEIIQHTQLEPLVSTNRHVHFLDYVLGKAKPLVTVEQALIVQATLDGIYESSRTGREVRIKA